MAKKSQKEIIFPLEDPTEYLPEIVKVVKDFDDSKFFVLTQNDIPWKVLPIPKPKDWIVCWTIPNEKVRVICQVVSVDRSTNSMIVEAVERTKRKKLNMNLNAIYEYIGSKVENLETYGGVKLQVPLYSLKTKFGNMTVYTPDLVEEQVKQNTLPVVNEIADKWRSFGYPKVFPLEFSLETGLGGGIIGLYTMRPSENKDLLQIALMPPAGEPLQLVLWHELGHALEFNYFSESVKTEWIKAYDSFNKIFKDTDKLLLQMLESFSLKGMSAREEEKRESVSDLWNDIFALIEEKSNLNEEDLMLLVKSKDKKTLQKVWPKSFMIAERNPLITDYANKSWSEHWCDCFSYFHVKPDKLPQELKTLVIKTMKSVLSR